MLQIKHFDFSQAGRTSVLNESKGRDWPVVYLINNDHYLYIGETSNFYNRFGQHLDNKQKKKLQKIHVIFDDEFNKSAILDIEQSLIRMCSADQKFTLLNGNAGQSAKHNYYQREKYLNKIETINGGDGIWELLHKFGLTKETYDYIVNSDLFTYSPYTSLTAEQEEICYNVLNDILNGLNGSSGKGITCIINGSAGTGKTILAIYIMSLLVNANKQLIDPYKDEESSEHTDLKNKTLHNLKKYVEKNGALKIGYVLPMTSIRATIKTVFRKSRNGLKSNMVIGPTDVVGEHYDILLVDEAHRLPRRKNISWLGEFDKCCQKLNMIPENSNTLDWIVRCSKYRILFYDKDQSIKPSDIPASEFKNSLSKTITKEYSLTSQMRCQGGKPYIDYLNKIFKCGAEHKEQVQNYDIKVFDCPDEMINDIKQLNARYGLCRVVAGYSWRWKTKGKSSAEINANGLYDIKFANTYSWNMTNKEWILRKDSVNEIGCIHTTQGYDLNYVGVIFGREIDYDPDTDTITIDPDKFYDTNVKKGCTPGELKQYIVNSYKIMMERGIKGCYVYACNDHMRDYLKKYFN